MRTAGLEKETEAHGGPRVAEQHREQSAAEGLHLDGATPQAFDPRMLLGLQAAAGNGAVAALIAQTRPAPPITTEIDVEAVPITTEAPPLEKTEPSPERPGTSDEDLATIDAQAEPGTVDPGDQLSISAGSPEPYEGGGAGGGNAIEQRPPPRAPSLEGMEPGQALAAVSVLPPGPFLEAIGGVAESVDQTAGAEHTRLLQDPPSRLRHPGAPGTVEAPSSRRIPVAADARVEALTRVPDGPAVAVRPAPAPTPSPPLPTSLAPEPVIASAGSGQLAGADAEQLSASIARLPTADIGLHMGTGPLPQLPLEGNADPNQVHQQQAHLDRALGQQHADGRHDAGQDLGETSIFPMAPAETLVAGIAAGPSATGEAPGAEADPDDAVSVIAQQEKGAETYAAAADGIRDLSGQRSAYQEKRADERAKSEQELTAIEHANIAEQAGERGAAQQEVLSLRGQWTSEQQHLVARAHEESGGVTKAALDTTSTARTQGQEEAAAHYAQGKAEAEAARREGEQHAAAERQKAQSQSAGGFLGVVASAARSVFDAAKQAVQSAFDHARQLVRTAIERAQQLAVAAMERARQAIVGAIRLAGDALAAIGDRVLVAFPAVRDRFRRAIQERVARAEATVNQLSNGLKQAIQGGLNRLGLALAAAVAGFRIGMRAVVARVASAVRGAVDFARNALAGLGTFAVLVADVAANPGRWLANLAAAAQDGIRNHLWPDLKQAVQGWFSEKVDSVLGLGAAAWSLLRKGGITTMQVASFAWEGLQSMIPPTIVWVLIEKLVALIVPAAAAVMLVIQALQAAWGSVGRIIQAFDAFMAFLKGVRWGNAGPLFGKAVAAGAVAVIEFVSQFLLQRLMAGAGKVAGKLRSLAKRVGTRLAGVGRGIVGAGKSLGRRFGTVGERAASLVAKVKGSVKNASTEAGLKTGEAQIVESAGVRVPPGHEFATAPDFRLVEPDGSVSVRHGPVNPGPLDPDVGNTFRSGSYTATKLGKSVDLFRAYSKEDRKFGPYWSRTPPSGPLQAKIGSAILKEFDNEANRAVHIRIPEGETIFEGFAAPQRSTAENLLGGGSQIYLLRIDASWEVGND